METILDRLASWAAEAPEAQAHRYKKEGTWNSISARELWERVFYLALFLESRGMREGKTGTLLSYNRSEWVITEFAYELSGGMSAGLYPNASAKDIQFILNDTQCVILAVQNRDYFKKISGGKEPVEIPSTIQTILVFEGDASFHPKAISFEKALDEGKKLAVGKKAENYLKKIDPKKGSFIIYTSGTTGDPKGAILSQDNLAYTSDLIIRTWNLKTGSGSTFSFLPLCHVAEKLQAIGVAITCRYTVNFCSTFERLAEELPEAKPSVLLCVPRLWEKMMEGVQSKLSQAVGPKKKLADWAFSVGERVARAKYEGGSVRLRDHLEYKLADRLIFSKVKAKLGIDQAEKFASGAAALPAHVTRWFRILGVEILEDFGQTESTGVICMTPEGVDCAGTVGKPVEGVLFKLGEDGEILTKGRHVFLGYLNQPQATRDAIDADGWLHTGDLGELTDRGMIRIRGRKKEIMKTSGGKMVAPAPIEQKLKECQWVSQAVMVGDGRKYFVALFTLPEDKLKQYSGGSDVVEAQEVLGAIKRHLDQVNAQLAQFEKIKFFKVLGREFSIEQGEMTPTLKMKRSVIEERFHDLIESMYN